MNDAQTMQLLLQLATMGGFRIWRDLSDGTWNASIELPTPQGVTAKIASDFRQPTLAAALLQLDSRVSGLRKTLTLPGRG